jgi:hypothetical protein
MSVADRPQSQQVIEITAPAEILFLLNRILLEKASKVLATIDRSRRVHSSRINYKSKRNQLEIGQGRIYCLANVGRSQLACVNERIG